MNRLHPNYRILACAPSDAAADVICTRLMTKFSPDKLVRLNWWQRLIASVPPNLLKYCIQFGDLFDLPTLERLGRCNVVVCTCATAGVLRRLESNVIDTPLNGAFKPLSDPYHDNFQWKQPLEMNFDVVLVDEASQAIELEAIVPLSLCRPNGVMVVAGDPKQLGAAPRSPLFKYLNHGQSILERLLHHPLYSKIAPKVVMDKEKKTKKKIYIENMGVYLVNNYRSHNSIISLSSRLFYHNSLIESGTRAEIDSMLSWQVIQERASTMPSAMVFIGVDGQHAHEIDAPSFYNETEIGKVVEVCKLLMKDTQVAVSTADIGVIGAFRSHVLRLRQALRAEGLGAINVGTVEDYQGQEVKVAIVSTVLSTRVPQMEIDGALGLLGDSRRFNVAITRGKALVVVIGQPYCLYTDNSWRELLNYADARSLYLGMPCKLLDSVKDDERDIDDLLSEVAKVSVLGAGLENNSSYNCHQYTVGNMEWRVLL